MVVLRSPLPLRPCSSIIGTGEQAKMRAQVDHPRTATDDNGVQVGLGGRERTTNDWHVRLPVHQHLPDGSSTESHQHRKQQRPAAMAFRLSAESLL